MAGIVEAVMTKNVDPSLNSFYDKSVVLMADYVSKPFTIFAVMAVILVGLTFLSGNLSISFKKFLTTLITIGLITGVALAPDAYNSLLGQYLLKLPEELLAVAAQGFSPDVGPPEPLNGPYTIDQMYIKIDDAASRLFATDEYSGYFYGAVLWCIGLVMVIVMFVALLMVKVGITVVATLGPLFIISLLFQFTRDYFTKWLTFATQFIVTGAILGLYLGLTDTIIETSLSELDGADGLEQILGAANPLFILLPVVGVLFTMTTQYASSLTGGIATSIGNVLQRISRGATNTAKSLANKATNRATRSYSENKMAHRQIRIQNRVKAIKKK